MNFRQSTICTRLDNKTPKKLCVCVMFCAQDSLAQEDNDEGPAALAAVSQYACKRRTTIDNCNKIFTVSVVIKT